MSAWAERHLQKLTERGVEKSSRHETLRAILPALSNLVTVAFLRTPKLIKPDRAPRAVRPELAEHAPATLPKPIVTSQNLPPATGPASSATCWRWSGPAMSSRHTRSSLLVFVSQESLSQARCCSQSLSSHHRCHFAANRPPTIASNERRWVVWPGYYARFWLQSGNSLYCDHG
jgi:hypothetical protein